MIQKQLKTMAVLLAVFLVAVGVYFGIRACSEIPEGEKISVDSDGDTLGISGRPYIYDVIPADNVQSIYVKNSHGEYRFNMDSIAGGLVLEGSETLSFDREKLSYLYVNTCNVLAMAKVEDPSDDLSEYGLPGGVSNTYFTVAEKDGTEHTVYIGALLPTGAAYYCKSADKPHIYVIDTMIEDCVLAPAKVYIAPLLAPPVPSENRYSIDNIKIIRNGELFVAIEKAGKTEGAADEAALAYNLTHPGVFPAARTVLDAMLEKFVAFIGSGVEEYNLTSENLESKLSEYGLTKPSAEIIYSFAGREFRVVFGNKTEDGSAYYVLNMSQGTICTLPVEDVPFMEYDVMKFMDRYIFQMDINNIKSMTVTNKRHSETFLLEGENNDLTVTKESNGEIVETYSFRQFYIDLLLINYEDYADAPAEPNEILSYRIETRDGREFRYNFYDLSTRKVFFTVNGEGQFYANRDIVERVVTNLDKLIHGEKIVSQALE